MAKKRAKKLQNPFIYSGYESPDYFCDRLEETKNLISNLQNGRNTVLMAPRKIGKTGLIHHVFHELKREDKNRVCIYVDIFHTQNQHDFVQTLGKAIVEERMLSAGGLANKVLAYFSSWRPTLSFDPITGSPAVSVNIDRTQTQFTLDNIFDYLAASEREVYVAIDEFQAIADYPEKGTEALLRSRIQFIHNAHFIFSGSKLHLMTEMFFSPKRPFYQSTSTMSLRPIPEQEYYDFASRFFQRKKGDLNREVFHRLYAQFDGYTWYLQSVLNRLYENYSLVDDYGQVEASIADVLSSKVAEYESLMMFLTSNQFRLLKAIAREGLVTQPQSNEFIRRHDLPAPASIKKALDLLTDKDLVYRTSEGYIIYDRFLNLWLKRL